MGPSVYLETSIISYLVPRPSRDLIIAAHQQVTAEWWATRRPQFTLYASELVAREASGGDVNAAQRRLELLQGIPLVDATQEAQDLALHFLAAGVFPPGADADASHVALAAVHGMEYSPTWNLQHIANAQVRTRIEAVCRALGYEPPVLCTPEELMGG